MFYQNGKKKNKQFHLVLAENYRSGSVAKCEDWALTNKKKKKQKKNDISGKTYLANFFPRRQPRIQQVPLEYQQMLKAP